MQILPLSAASQPHRNGQVLRVGGFDQPILHPLHGDLPSVELALGLRPHCRQIEQPEAIIVCGVVDPNTRRLRFIAVWIRRWFDKMERARSLRKRGFVRGLC